MISAVSRARDRSLETMTGRRARARSSCARSAAAASRACGAAGVVERDVGRTLDAAIAVPVGLAVADEGQQGHRSSLSRGRMVDGAHAAAGSASASARSTSLVPASIFTVARASARVAPRLTITIGQSPAACALEQADAGVDDERRAGDHQRVAAAHELLGLAELLGGDELAEEDDVGLEHPAAHACSRERRKPSVLSGSTSPSGPSGDVLGHRGSTGCRPRPAAARSRRSNTCPQCVQKTRRIVPCSSTTRRLPARTCRPSTFCVMTPDRDAARLERRRARGGRRWARRRRTRASPRWLPTQ